MEELIPYTSQLNYPSISEFETYCRIETGMGKKLKDYNQRLSVKFSLSRKNLSLYWIINLNNFIFSIIKYQYIISPLSSIAFPALYILCFSNETGKSTFLFII